ncbi:MAG: hypothetical protein KDI36_00370 [Pseudomonadales bacterium]|nr:hypothetical protein [Pseudomonadales bacterium]
MQEADLYEPLKMYFEGLGYELHAEVNHCDLVACRGDEILIIELKRSLNLTLLLQALDRQQISPLVYLAVPETGNKRSKRWRTTLRLLRKLALGLILVNLKGPEPSVKCWLEPQPVQPATGKRGRKLRQELAGRSGNYNIGGSSGQTLMTAYRERAVYAAWCLHQRGPVATRELHRLGCDKQIARLLRDNHYGWFEAVSRGIYRLTAEGESALKSQDYPALLAACERRYMIASSEINNQAGKTEA